MGQPARLPFAEGQQTSQKRAELVLSLVPTQEGAPPNRYTSGAPRREPQGRVL